VRTLWRYLLTRYLLSLLTVLCVLILLVLTIEVLLDVDHIVESEAGLSGVLLKLVSSYLLQYLLPASVLVSAFTTLAGAARHREITALKAGGISPLTAVLPLILAAILLSAASFVASDTLIVTASRAWNRLTHENAGEVAVRRGTFWYHKGHFIYNFADTDASGTVVHEVTVFELDDQNRLRRRIGAPRATVSEASRWHFENATVHLFDPDNPGQPPHVEHGAEVTVALDQEPNQALLKKEVASLSVADLRGHVDERKRSGRDVTRASALLHTRLSDPLTVLVFALLAIPIGIRVEQTRSLSRGALQVVLIMFVYYSAREAASTLAFEGVVPASASWVVLLVAAAAGWLGLARVPR
jgi:lipopolysaccharide export system permease protein